MLKFAKHVPPLLFENRLTELTYFTTDACNMKCRHCFVHEALNNRRQHLSVEEISRIGAHVPAMQRVHLGGGEPFARTDIAEIAVCVSNEWNAGVVNLPTNGWLTDRIVAGMHHFGQHGQGDLRLFFSINSADPVKMDEFTQVKGSFERWRKSIDAALGLSARYPRITIVGLATFNEYNQDEFIELIDFLHRDVGVEDFSFQLVRTHGDYAPELDVAKFREANAYYFQTWNRQNPLLASFRHAVRDSTADYVEAPEFRTRCTSGKVRVVMSPEGDVYPCEKLGYPNLRQMAKWNMGNVRLFDYDVNALVRSPRARAVYARIRDGKCHCDHNIDQSLSQLSSAAFRNRVLKGAAIRLVGGQGKKSAPALS
jgi:MoaA/NifB/PqqE/SkfB family radical SAM enzyme